MRKIVFVDIDGTLITERQVCPPSASEAIRTARSKGHLVYICSGRPRSIISDEVVNIGFDGIVSASGAHIESGGTVLYHNVMDSSLLKRVTGYLEEMRVPYKVEGEGGSTAGALTMEFTRRIRDSFIGTIDEAVFSKRISLFLENLHSAPYDIAKVVFIGTDSGFIERISAVFAQECDIFSIEIPLLGGKGGEISTKGIHKGFALGFVADYHGIDRADTIALGDSGNDSKMLEAAGLGIAMGNADPALKKIASYVTDTVAHNGLAKAFKYAGLI